MNLVAQNPSLYLEEIASYLLDTWDLRVSIMTISRALKRQKISQKATQRVAAQRVKVKKERPKQLDLLNGISTA